MIKSPAAKAKHNETATRIAAALRAAQRQFLWTYKAERGCADCGERDPIVLTFAHKEPRHKKGGRAVAGMTGSGWPSLMKEIARCEVLCWNCHTRRDDVFRRKHVMNAE